MSQGRPPGFKDDEAGLETGAIVRVWNMRLAVLRWMINIYA